MLDLEHNNISNLTLTLQPDSLQRDNERMTKSMLGKSASTITCFCWDWIANNRAGPAEIVYRHSVCYHTEGKVGLSCIV